ncbi:MAG: HAMP domain-containing sensor histidine kinase [Anaerolineae bacterium]
MAIRYRLILWYSGLLAVIIILFGTILYNVTRWTLVNSVDTTLTQTADQVIENSRPFMLPEFGNPSLHLSLPELDLFRASGVVVEVWEMNGEPQLAGTSSNLPNYQQPLDPAALIGSLEFRTPDAAPADQFNVVRLNGEDWRVLTRPVLVWDDRPIVIQTAAPFVTVNQASRALLAIMVISMGVALVGSIALGMGLSNRALAPIETITRTAAGIVATDDLKTRLEWKGPHDELGRLTSVFNQMMERLERLFSVQQRFVADVSHELRTPLTAIRGHLDLIKRYGMDDMSMEAIESEVDRMSRMVNDLLLLAKADFGGLKLDMRVIDLDTVVSEVYREARVLAKDHDLEVTIQDFEPVRISGDSDRLKQLLLNLVSNAIKFTPDGGKITLNLRRTPTDAQVEVIDTGIGISADDLKRIFDRFYQAEPSRVRKGEGAGLGLSIAKWIAEAHAGSIEVTSELGMGTTFVVSIPHLERATSTPAAASAVTRPRLGGIRRPPAPPTPKK